MPLKRIVPALLLFLLGTVAASAQEPGDLWFHRTAAGSSELIQRAAVLDLSAAGSGAAAKAAPGAVDIDLIVEAAVQWQVAHGYLTDADLLDAGPEVTISGSGITITFHVPGGPDITIVLPNGPFLPRDVQQRLMAVTVVRPVSTGF
jgi:hypothetical protein